MGKLRQTMIVTLLAAALAGCSSEAASPTATPKPTLTPSTPPPTDISRPTQPVFPKSAKAHSADGAKAFVAYYMQLVDYAQWTFDTVALAAASEQTCTGCQGGITALKKLEDQHALVTGGKETVSALEVSPIEPGLPVTVRFNLTNTDQRVAVPGAKPLLHPSTTIQKVMTLNPRRDGWTAAEFRDR